MLRRHSGCPDPTGRSCNAEIRIGDSIIMLNDETPEMGGKSPQAYGGSPVSFYVHVEDVDAAWKRAVDAGGEPTMPLADMRWLLSQHVADPTPEEMQKGQEEFFSQMHTAPQSA